MSGAMQAASAGASRGLIRMSTPSQVTEQEQEEKRAREQERLLQQQGAPLESLAGYVRNQFEIMKRHREMHLNERLNKALRMFNGEYEADVLASIREFGGSEVFARMVAAKCRGATSLLREIYLSAIRPWGLSPTPSPTMPDSVVADIDALVTSEASSAAIGGEPVTEEKIVARKQELLAMARREARKRAADEAKEAERRINDMLVEGGFYSALAEFLVDLPLFPFACIKGPVVRIAPSVKWENGELVQKNVARMFWERVSPFDIWWTAGASNFASADIIERERYTRSELNELLGVAGYNDKALRAVLRDYGTSGYREVMDSTDQVRADSERRESPAMNESGIIECLRFTGSVQGKLLREYGWSGTQAPDEDKDYAVELWLIGQHVIKVQMNPSPRKRHPYYVTSYEKVPGTVSGNALPDTLADIQDVCNATLRALVNNLAISSGPQVVLNEDMLAPGENPDELYPWKRWRTVNPPMANQREPITFFQPTSNVQQLLATYEKFTQIADELSAIPRYVTGSDRMGGAGRTASGLAMLMGNASKLLQTVAANIDLDVFKPMLQALYDIIMLTDTDGTLRGDESVEVKGVVVAMQKETERQRQMEMLQMTANPVDMGILGIRGRANILRAVAENLGLDGAEIVPPDEELAAREAAEKAQQAAMMQAGLAGPGTPGTPGTPGGPGSPPPDAASQAQGAQRGGEETGPSAIQGPRTNLQQQRPGG